MKAELLNIEKEIPLLNGEKLLIKIEEFPKESRKFFAIVGDASLYDRIRYIHEPGFSIDIFLLKGDKVCLSKTNFSISNMSPISSQWYRTSSSERGLNSDRLERFSKDVHSAMTTGVLSGELKRLVDKGRSEGHYINSSFFKEVFREEL